ncbi:MAG: nickel pincer cofactor biosynthesis protein LarC [Promethearchaeota archaeon]
MKLLYIDATNSGISGDMFLASLLRLIPEPNIILENLKSLRNYLSDVSKLKIDLINIKRSGIQINKLKIDIKENKNYRKPKVLKSALNKFLNEKSFSNSAKTYANNVLNSLIQAEAEVHGKLFDNIHMHELSSVDTLIDILGVTQALDILGGFNKDFKIFCSKLPLGGGLIKTAHGLLPVPAPATSKILETSNLIVYNGPIESELVTPTGAALLTNLNPKTINYKMILKKIAYSTGQKEFNNFLNILRLFYGEIKSFEFKDEIEPLEKYREPITILETDIDDVSGEIIGDFIKKMIKENILDIQVIPNITKKNRPGYLIKVLCSPENKFVIIEKIIDELGTLGVRFSTINRICVERKIENKKIEINGKNYELKYKISYIESESGRKIVNIKPEYEDLKKISEISKRSIKEVQFFAQTLINQIYNKNKHIE